MKYAMMAVVAGIIGICVLSYVSAYGTANKLEQGLIAAQEDSRNVLATYSSTILEATQIPEMQRDDLTAVVTAALDARYGEEGSRAMFQFIQEQNPQIDSAVYIKLQQIIQAGRGDFAVAQRKLVDLKRVYNTHLGSLWTGMWMRVAGFPKIDLDDFEIVTNARTEEAFRTKRDEPIKLR